MTSVNQLLEIRDSYLQITLLAFLLEIYLIATKTVCKSFESFYSAFEAQKIFLTYYSQLPASPYHFLQPHLKNI